MAFTAENIQTAVQGVKEIDSLASYLRVPDSKRDEIREQFRGMPKQQRRQQQVKAYVDYFMAYNPLASWRAVIIVLDMLEETEAADAIRHLAEPLTGIIGR